MATATASPPKPHPLLLETLIGPAEAARLFPDHRGRGRVNPSTVWRWIRSGVRTSTGEVVRLEAIRIGTGWRTTVEAIERFVARLNADAPPPPAPRTPTQRQRAARRADDELDRAGW